MKKIEIQMLLYTLTKEFMEVQGNMLNASSIILFYKMLGWFDGHNIGVEPRRPRFNPLYQYILCGVCIFVNIPCTCV
jgi:hypothetical protein